MEIPYSMEKLIPVVAELAEKYTSKESTSVTYETAEKLMEAVIYTISLLYADETGYGEKSGQQKKIYPAEIQKLTPKAAYEAGYECVIQKVKETQTAYNEMILNFHSYGNENYDDTVTKAIPGFFQSYNARFFPQENVITMDYPTLLPVEEKSGITAIETYLNYISMEQRFLQKMPEDYVVSVLTGFQASYRKQFYNICRILLRHFLGSALIGKKIGETAVSRDYEALRGEINSRKKEGLEELLAEVLEVLVRQQYEGDEELFWYLRQDIRDFTVELFTAAEEGRLEMVVRL